MRDPRICCKVIAIDPGNSSMVPVASDVFGVDMDLINGAVRHYVHCYCLLLILLHHALAWYGAVRRGVAWCSVVWWCHIPNSYISCLVSLVCVSSHPQPPPCVACFCSAYTSLLAARPAYTNADLMGGLTIVACLVVGWEGYRGSNVFWCCSDGRKRRHWWHQILLRTVCCRERI